MQEISFGSLLARSPPPPMYRGSVHLRLQKPHRSIGVSKKLTAGMEALTVQVAVLIKIRQGGQVHFLSRWTGRADNGSNKDSILHLVEVWPHWMFQSITMTADEAYFGKRAAGDEFSTARYRVTLVEPRSSPREAFLLPRLSFLVDTDSSVYLIPSTQTLKLPCE